jgi:hypothetical protein
VCLFAKGRRLASDRLEALVVVDKEVLGLDGMKDEVRISGMGDGHGSGTAYYTKDNPVKPLTKTRHV